MKDILPDIVTFYLTARLLLPQMWNLGVCARARAYARALLSPFPGTISR